MLNIKNISKLELISTKYFSINSIQEQFHARHGGAPVYEIVVSDDKNDEYVFVLLRQPNETSEEFAGSYKCELWSYITKPKMVGSIYVTKSELKNPSTFVEKLEKIFLEIYVPF